MYLKVRFLWIPRHFRVISIAPVVSSLDIRGTFLTILFEIFKQNLKIA